MTKHVLTGEINQIAYDGSEIVCNGKSSTSCPHAVPIRDQKGNIEEYRIPWVIKIYTEGGYVAEMEYLECALNTAKTMGFKIHRKTKEKKT